MTSLRVCHTAARSRYMDPTAKPKFRVVDSDEQPVSLRSLVADRARELQQLQDHELAQRLAGGDHDDDDVPGIMLVASDVPVSGG